MKFKIIILVLFSLLSIYPQNYYIIENSKAGSGNSYISILPPSVYTDRVALNKPLSSTINVTYEGTPPNSSATTAFEYAKDIWASLIKTNVPISIKVKWANTNTLGQGTLASTATNFRNNFTNAPFTNFQYPTSLAEKLSGQNLTNTDADIQITFNTDYSFYYGIDARPTTNTFDFVTISLHEIAHGLGFASSMGLNETNEAEGAFGIPGYQTNINSLPTIFDKLLYYNSSTDRLLNTTNPSTLLKSKLTSEKVYFDGTNAISVNSNQAVKLYAPSTYVGGSSISHLDQLSFPRDETNSLMLWDRNPAEAIHTPGIVTLSILQDLGWDVVRLIIPSVPITSVTSKTTWARGTTNIIKWMDNKTGSINIELYKKNSDNSYSFITTINSAAIPSSYGSNTYPWGISGSLQEGTYRLKFIGLTAGDGTCYSSDFNISSSAYYVDQVVFSPGGGTYATGTNLIISLSSSTTGAEIRYTTDGSEPTTSSTLYNPSTKISLTSSQTTTIKAKAFKSTYIPSNTTSASYSFIEMCISVFQMDETGNSFGNAKIWTEFGYWTDLPSNTPQSTKNHNNLIFLASQAFKDLTTQKFNTWTRKYNGTSVKVGLNPHSFDVSTQKSGSLDANFKTAYDGIVIKNKIAGSSIVAGTIRLKDPWFSDTATSYGGVMQNRGNGAVAYEFNSPFSFSSNPNYKGTFLYENVDFSTLSSNYKVIAQPSISYIYNGQTRTAVFASWQAVPQTSAKLQNPIALETGVVFQNANAVVQANFHGTNLSENTNAIANNSQRKIARDYSGRLHLVYESEGRIWYERSTDGGATWQIMNNSQPLDALGGKLPSIDAYSNQIAVVWQEKYSGDAAKADIKIAYIDPSTGLVQQSSTLTPLGALLERPLYSTNANPSIAYGYETKYMVVWENKTSSYPGLVFAHGILTSGAITKLQTGSISNTTSSSVNPSISVNKDVPSLGAKHFCIAWEESNQIKFQKYNQNYSPTNTVTAVNSSYTISNGSSYPVNKKPSVFALSDTSARVAWNGVYNDGADNYSVAIFKSTDNTQFWNFGDNVNSVSVNGNPTRYAVAWAKTNNVVEFTPNTSLSAITTLSGSTFSGKDIQISNGTNPVDFRALTLNTPAGGPNFFQTKQIFTTNKENSVPVYSGRGGCVYTDYNQFYFSFGDVEVNGQKVNFVEMPENAVINNTSQLNKYLITEPFKIDDNSKFSYSAQFGTIDSALALKSLKAGENVKYKVELIDDKTGTTISTFDNLAFTNNNITGRGSKTYSISAKGTGSKTVRLRLVTEANIKAGYAISSIYSTSSALKKASVQNLEVKDLVEVKEYALGQNYPNPFNPSTVISYQIPTSGKVTLKVYDVIGKEIATIVDGYKEAGKYQVTFECGKLASGVYMYKIESGNYSQSRKMILTK